MYLCRNNHLCDEEIGSSELVIISSVFRLNENVYMPQPKEKIKKIERSKKPIMAAKYFFDEASTSCASD